jgi:HAD superfamily hydrolase (TIGR01509 family)
LRYNGRILRQVITFDAGQTLIELDLDFLARRLAERGVGTTPEALGDAAPAAWAQYDQMVDAGADHVAGWHALMTALLRGAGITDPAPQVDWLWAENPRANLWRKPIAGMVELAHELTRNGARVAVLSNSEGKLAELLAEIGLADAFAAIIDSGRIGLEKPGKAIFDHALAVLGGSGADAIHIGDSWNADIVGARNAGWRAIWYGRAVRCPLVEDPGVAIARDPAETREALIRFGAI